MALRFVVLCCFAGAAWCAGLKEEFSWSRIDYDWPDRRPSSDGTIVFPSTHSSPGKVQNVYYNYTTNIPMGANMWRDKVFITVPRRRLGVPSTLNYVRADTSQRHNTPLIPYPDWSVNTRGKNNISFVSVYRVGIDECDRMWFVDTGRIELPNDPQQLQPPALLVIDLKTDKIIRRHEFPSDLIRPSSTLASVTIDVTSSTCGDAFAYVPDVGGYGLIVYSYRENKSWRVTHNFFYLEPDSGEFSIGGHDFQWNDGIFSIALSERKSDGSRDAYFHSMAGTNMYKVSTRVLNSERLATRSYHVDDFKLLGNRGQGSQTSSSDLHKESSTLFLGMVNKNALGCWNVNQPLSTIDIVQRDDERMIYPSDVKVYKDKVMVLTNTMPVFLYGQLDYNRTNFRVWVQDVKTAVEGTKCSQRKTTSYSKY